MFPTSLSLVQGTMSCQGSLHLGPSSWIFHVQGQVDIVEAGQSTCQAIDSASQAVTGRILVAQGPVALLAHSGNRSSRGRRLEARRRRTRSYQQPSRYQPAFSLEGISDISKSSGCRRAGFLCRSRMRLRGSARCALAGKVPPAFLVIPLVRKPISRRTGQSILAVGGSNPFLANSRE